MSANRTVLLIHPVQDGNGQPELIEALNRAGIQTKQLILNGDYSALLDALDEDVLPVVVKG